MNAMRMIGIGLLAVIVAVGGCKDEDGLKGSTIKLDGTVKAHNEFHGTPQTVLTRCKFHGVVDSPSKG